MFHRGPEYMDGLTGEGKYVRERVTPLVNTPCSALGFAAKAEGPREGDNQGRTSACFGDPSFLIGGRVGRGLRTSKGILFATDILQPYLPAGIGLSYGRKHRTP